MRFAGIDVAAKRHVAQDQVVIHDNWRVAGLRGTGGCDFSIENVFVPEEMSYLGRADQIAKQQSAAAARRLGDRVVQ